MKVYRILFSISIFLGLFLPCEGLFGGDSLQDFIDGFVDAAKFHLEGIISLNDSAIHEMWYFFKTKYHRVYSTIDEEKQRLRLFREHLQYVLESNFEKLRSFKLELNEFADWTMDEFNSLKKGLIVSSDSKRDFSNDDPFRRSLRKLHQRRYHLRRINRRRFKDKRFLLDWLTNLFGGNQHKPEYNDIFDWRTKGVVSSVKNQLKCGCCYAFATATIMETLYAMKTKSQNIIDFSAQQICDCSSSNGNKKCNGGSFGSSIQYILGKGGKIATDASYPYVGIKEHACQTNSLNEIHLGNIEYGSLPEGDEKKLAEALTNYGPLFIGIDTDTKLFMFYKSGVLKIDNCPTRRADMDHAMVVVGYGYDNANKIAYWIIKNSWGTKWGENGYLRLAKDSGNMCGVATMAYYGKLI